MNSPLHNWPAPTGEALAHSRELEARIRRAIADSGGMISFARFMRMALYEPGLGYYSGGARKFGAGGDFVTAPEMSPLFSACLARQCEQLFALTGAATVLELGAGTGIMACDLIGELDRRGAPPDRYFILETSADLRERQRCMLAEKLPGLCERVQWLECLPEAPINGVILANEVLDALPVNRVCVTGGGLRERTVALQNGAFGWSTGPDPDWLQELAEKIEPWIGELPEAYVTEYNPRLGAFIASLSDVLGKGAVLLIDYGYPRREYYHPQRTEGTLICHYRHRRHEDPFIYVGLQDITASVDFTLVAESAAAAGLGVAGFTTQAAFLISLGLEEIIAGYGAGGGIESLRRAREAGQLILPGQMGEQFKAMALTRGVDAPLAGFSFRDHVHRL